MKFCRLNIIASILVTLVGGTALNVCCLTDVLAQGQPQSVMKPNYEISETLLNPPLYNGVTVQGECVTFVVNYASQVLKSTIPGIGQYHPYNATNDYASDGAHWIWDDQDPKDGHDRLQPSNTDRFANDGTNFPQAQDIMVWSSGTGITYGHIAIVDAANSRNDVWVVDSNWSNNDDQKGRKRHITIDGGILGWFRIKGSSGGGFDPSNLYVDSIGNDSNNGSSSTPFKTVAHAVDLANPAQSVTIHIAQGSYPNPISTSKHIQFVTWGSGTVTIGR